MKATYMKRFQTLSHALKNTDLMERARMDEHNTFSRKRKMPFEDILLSCLARKGLTTTLELRTYFKQKEDLSMEISKQGYLQQRKRLNPDIFTHLNDQYLMDFYNSSEVSLWNGFLLLGIDGSKAEVPNSEGNQLCFSKSNNQHSEQGKIRALVSGMYDILNGFYLDIGIAHISTSETEMAKANLEHLKVLGIRCPILVIFDRGYPAMEFIDFLEEAGIHYLFRLSSNDYKKERNEMKSSDKAVTLLHTSQRLTKIRQKHPERYQHMKEKANTNTRISKSFLPMGKELALMTNLSKHYSDKQLQDLYYKRWEIEKKYHTLKNKMKFESVTGKATVYVYQDFRAQILVYNMIQDVRNAANANLRKKHAWKIYKYFMQTNENIAIGLFKEEMIKILLETDPLKREERLIELQGEIEKHVLPVRDLKSAERKKNISNKYKNNQKNSF